MNFPMDFWLFWICFINVSFWFVQIFALLNVSLTKTSFESIFGVYYALLRSLCVMIKLKSAPSGPPPPSTSVEQCCGFWFNRIRNVLSCSDLDKFFRLVTGCSFVIEERTGQNCSFNKHRYRTLVWKALYVLLLLQFYFVTWDYVFIL